MNLRRFQKSELPIPSSRMIGIDRGVHRATIVFRMDEPDDIRRRLKVSNLQAKLELFEIERAALLGEIMSPLTSQDRREEAVMRRTELRHHCAEIVGLLKGSGK